MRVLARLAQNCPSRRRLIGGLAVAGVSFVAAGCGTRLPSISALAEADPSYRAEATPPPALVRAPSSPRVLVGATFGRVILLEGVTIDQDTVRAGDDLRLWLHWQASAQAQEDLRSIGQVIAANGRVVASEDDQIGGRKHHLTRWRIGERVIDEMRVRVAPSCAPGEYGVTVGVLRADNETTVPVTHRATTAATWQEDAALVGTIEIVAA